MSRALALALVIAALPQLAAAEDAAFLTVSPVPLVAGADAGQLDRLAYRGGLELASEDPRFGGWSDLAVTPDGSMIVAVSDEGSWMAGRLDRDGDGNLVGFELLELGELKGLDGQPLPVGGKAWRDAEAMTLAEGGGFLVGFEHQHRIWYYPGSLAATPVESDMPLALKGLDEASANHGIEGLARLPDGRQILFVEGLDGEGGTLGFVQGKVTWTMIPYVRPDNFQLTGTAALANGDVVLLERFYTPETGVRVRLRLLPAAEIGKALVQPLPLLAHFEAPTTLDNFEGVTAWTDAAGKTRLLLLSDDNFNKPAQRTLLMEFELAE